MCGQNGTSIANYIAVAGAFFVFYQYRNSERGVMCYR